MSTYTVETTPAGLSSYLGSVISPAALAMLMADLASSTNLNVSFGSDGDSLTFGASPNPQLALIDTPIAGASIDAATVNAAGGVTVPFSDAFDLNNSGPLPLYVLTESSSFLELQSGSWNISSGSGNLIVDGSHLTAGDSLVAYAGPGYSFLIGGEETAVLRGSENSAGKATLVAGTGPETLIGGSGQDSLYGGGNTLVEGGHGSHQLLAGGFSLSAHDTLEAGDGIGQTLAVAEGNNTISTNGDFDTVYAGSGNDTIHGSLVGGDTFVLGQGNTDFVGGYYPGFYSVPPTDSIYIAQGGHGDTIEAGSKSELIPGGTVGPFNSPVVEDIKFQGYSASQVIQLIDAAKPASDGSITIDFGKPAGSTTDQTATFVHYDSTHIIFS